MKPVIQTIAVLTLMLLACFADNLSPAPPQEGHSCQLEHCPYKGLPPIQWQYAVEQENADAIGGDAYCIDLLHLHNPDSDSDELEDMLFEGMGSAPRLRDIQLEYYGDTLRVYDGNRLIGTHVDTAAQHGAFIDSLVLARNL